MIVTSLISIGDSRADSKGNVDASANFLESCAKKVEWKTYPRCDAANCTPRLRQPAFEREPGPPAEVLREAFALNDPEWSPAPCCAA